MEFRYKAREASGAMREGTVTASDQSSALALLQQSGLLVTRISPVRGLRGLSLNAEISFGASGRVKLGEVATFCGQFASLLGAGVPVLQSLSVLARQFRGKRLGSILDAVIRSVQGGDSLSQAMRQHKDALPPTLLYITAVAEVTGKLDECYDLLARQFEREDDFSRKVSSALAYPKVVLSVALVVIIFMLSFVLPTYGTMFQQMGASLPAATRVLMAVSGALRTYWYVIPAVAGALWFGVRAAMRQPQVLLRWQRFVLRLPLVGQLAYKREVAAFCRTMATMSKSGVPILSALLTTGEATQFLPLQRALDHVQEQVRSGESFGGALAQQPIFDRVTVEVISLGEQAGSLDTMLFRVAEINEKDVNSLLTRFTAALEPLLTLVLGGVVVGILVPMLLPMFDILGQVH